MNTQNQTFADTSLTGPDIKPLLSDVAGSIGRLLAAGHRVYTVSIVPLSRPNQRAEWQATITYIIGAHSSPRCLRVTDLAEISLYPVQHLRNLLHRHGIAPFRAPGHGRPQYIREEEARRFLRTECPGIRLDIEPYLVENIDVHAAPVAA